MSLPPTLKSVLQKQRIDRIPALPGGKTSTIGHHHGICWEGNLLLPLSSLPRRVSKDPQLLSGAFTRHRDGTARWANYITLPHRYC